MKNRLKKYIPTVKSLQKSRELKPLKSFLNGESLWKRDCQSVARGVAAGLAGAVIPGVQLFYAALLAILLRGNLPIALLATLITNPLTVIPVMYFIYFVGSLVVGNGNTEFVVQQFNWDFSSFGAFWTNFTTWIMQFGKAFLVGLPIVSASLGVIGYFGTIAVWKFYHFLFHKKKK